MSSPPRGGPRRGTAGQITGVRETQNVPIILEAIDPNRKTGNEAAAGRPSGRRQPIATGGCPRGGGSPPRASIKNRKCTEAELVRVARFR